MSESEEDKARMMKEEIRRRLMQIDADNLLRQANLPAAAETSPVAESPRKSVTFKVDDSPSRLTRVFNSFFGKKEASTGSVAPEASTPVTDMVPVPPQPVVQHKSPRLGSFPSAPLSAKSLEISQVKRSVTFAPGVGEVKVNDRVGMYMKFGKSLRIPSRSLQEDAGIIENVLNRSQLKLGVDDATYLDQMNIVPKTADSIPEPTRANLDIQLGRSISRLSMPHKGMPNPFKMTKRVEVKKSVSVDLSSILIDKLTSHLRRLLNLLELEGLITKKRRVDIEARLNQKDVLNHVMRGYTNYVDNRSVTLFANCIKQVTLS